MKIDFKKGDGLVPVIIQDNDTLQVRMLGYMNTEALEKTQSEGVVTFYSRSKQRLWTKGEESGNKLFVKEISQDCDQDTLLIKVDAIGPTCHKGNRSCFNNDSAQGFIYQLESILAERIGSEDSSSYTRSLYEKGIHKVAQKVGEEAVELVIEAIRDNLQDFKNEAADLLYHFILLLQSKGLTMENIEEVLEERNNP